ncbi:hypothetical protein C7974DRAFT_383255 [Boeremia exigua]|uniref:uncharacterized protein n=1 Tax=Boeremia exigua TaxID=749465 RepID=UPI001E8E339F|nr:uncharacterized protein C7974DRAFT_383255 [Boeremia exigua]KAH6644277.1 hypothetical protein C7974DRAFT_383255 [Boeremia exigua]
MSPSFLVVGATGNTGRGVVEILSTTIQASPSFSGHRIIAQTRSAAGAAASELAKLANVEVVEINWPAISSQWLREHGVERVFIASHNQPTQFAEESTFLYAALKAGVQYVVRISTTASNVRPDCPTYYPRQHWAIEAMLDTPAYAAMHWTSLQPNVFLPMWLSSAAELIKKVQSTGGQQDALRLMANETKPVGAIDPTDVSTAAAKLLLSQDSSKHNKARYVLNGPETITGAQIVAMVEQRIGTKVDEVVFSDMSMLEAFAAAAPDSKHLVDTMKDAANETFNSPLPTVPTSREILELAAPKVTPADALEQLLK